MRADLHVHAALTSALGCDRALFAALLARARTLELAALGLVAHLFTPNLPALYARLDELYPYDSDHYVADDGPALYPCIEVDTAEGPHLVALGRRDDVLAFYGRYATDVAARRTAPAAAFFARQAGLELISICAHPLRPRRELALLPADIAARFDATELNASDVGRGGEALVRQSEALAAAHELPLVGGSDAHHAAQVGAVQTRFTRPFASLAELRALIREKAFETWVHPEARALVDEARAAKRRILEERGIKQAG